MKQFKNLILAGALVLGLAGFAVSCDKYGEDIDNLQTQIDNQNKSLSDKLAAVESSIASLQSAQSNLESAIAAARDAAEKAALEAQKQAIETAKAELATAKAELQAAIAANQAAIEANAAGIEANAGEIAGVKAAVEGVEEEISGLQAAQDSLKSEIAAAKDAAEKAVLEAKNEAIEAAKAELTTVKAALEAAIQDNVDAIKAVNEAVNAIKATVEEKTSEIVGRIEALETFRTTTEAALDELAKAKETLTESVSKLNTEVVELGKRVTAVEAQVTALEKYKETNDEAVGANKAAIDSLIAQLATVQGKLSQLDGIKTQITALEQYKNDNDAAVNAIKQKQEKLESDLNGLDSQLKGLSDQISEINDDLDILYTALASGVTSVELVYSYSKQQVDHPYTDDPTGDNNYDHYYDGTNLTFGSTAEKDNVFGEGVVSNPLTFEAGNQYFVPQAFTVRVSPTNAVLTPEMITLVNSKGESLDFIEVVKVEKFNALLTRAAGGSGLWTVTVRLASYDKETFDAATKVKQGNEEKAVLFAVKVNNTAKYEGLKTRDVVSTYDLTVNYEAYEPEDDLKYYVDDTPIAKVNNRYKPNSKSLQQTVTANDLAPEYTWQNEPAVAPVTKGANVNVRLDGPATPPTGDNRSDEAVYPAVQGTPITISLHDKNGNPYTGIRAFYVVLDEQNAVESRPSELNAWKSYTYDGLGVVVEGTETTITIDSETAIDDIIGFRVYAVNYDGTLVDPDGKAFYVQLGTESEDWNAAATTIVPKGNPTNTTLYDPHDVKKTHSDSVSVTATKLTGADHFEWVTDEIGSHSSPLFYAYFVDENGTHIFEANTGSGSVSSTVDFSKIAKVFTAPASGITWNEYEDNKAYTGTLTVYSKSNHVLATIKVTFTKKLPTAAPAAFSVKDKQLANGTTWNAYLIPIEHTGDDPNATPMWTNAKAQFGAMKLDYLFNFGKNDAENYIITFAEAQPDANDPTKDDVNEVKNSATPKLEVKAKYIDNKTSHETTVVYNYGNISSKNPSVDYTVTATSFQTVFHEIYDEDTYTWRWAKKGDKPLSESGDGLAQKDVPKTTVEYGTGDGEVTSTKFELDLTKAIFGESTHDKLYNEFISPSYEGSVKVVSAKLTSDTDGTEDYFTIDASTGTTLVFTPISGATNPTENVPSTLTITYTDQYAVASDPDAEKVHTHSFQLKMTVTKR